MERFLQIELLNLANGYTSARKLVRIQKRQRNTRHDLNSKTISTKCQDQNVDLYKITFVDLTKVFDTVSRDGV